MLTTPFGAFLAIATLSCVAQFVYGMKRYFRQTETPWTLSLVKLGSLGGWGLTLALELRTAILPDWRGLTALGLLAFACGLFWTSVTANRQRPLTYVFSSDVPQHLVTWGPYRWIRHPFYTAYCAVFASGAVAVGSPLLAGWACGMTVLYVVAAWREEKKFTTSSFAEDYRRMQAKTGMMLPNVIKLFSRRAGPNVTAPSPH